MSDEKLVTDFMKSRAGKLTSIPDIVSALKLPTNVVTQIVYDQARRGKFKRAPEYFFVKPK